MDIYHTKKQTENTPRSYSYLLLKTLFHFISQCTSVPYLLSGLCKFGKELDNCNFTFIQPITRFLNKRNYEVCKYKTLGYTWLFSLHIEPPSYVFTRLAYKSQLCLQMVGRQISIIFSQGWNISFKMSSHYGIQVSIISSHGWHTRLKYVLRGWHTSLKYVFHGCHTSLNYVFTRLEYKSQLYLYMVGIQVSIMSQ